ncbi:MAG: hypothetical protein ACFB21_09970 [Opitutales bacterium]
MKPSLVFLALFVFSAANALEPQHRLTYRDVPQNEETFVITSSEFSVDGDNAYRLLVVTLATEGSGGDQGINSFEDAEVFWGSQRMTLITASNFPIPYGATTAIFALVDPVPGNQSLVINAPGGFNGFMAPVQSTVGVGFYEIWNVPPELPTVARGSLTAFDNASPTLQTTLRTSQPGAFAIATVTDRHAGDSLTFSVEPDRLEVADSFFDNLNKQTSVAGCIIPLKLRTEVTVKVESNVNKNDLAMSAIIVNAIPEPAAAPLLVGLGALVALYRKR